MPKKLLPLSTLILFLSGAAFSATEEEKLLERIAPVGDVCLVGDACAGGVGMVAASGGSGPQNPEEIYNTYCIACHGTGANNSPIRGDQAAWQPRLEKGIETLYQNAINGLNNNAMPAKGLCMACSDDAVRATVDFLIAPVQ